MTVCPLGGVVQSGPERQGKAHDRDPQTHDGDAQVQHLGAGLLGVDVLQPLVRVALCVGQGLRCHGLSVLSHIGDVTRDYEALR